MFFVNNKVYEYLKSYANTIPIFNETDTFTAEIPLANIKVEVTDKVTDNVTESRINKILSMINEMPGITSSQLAQKLNVSRMRRGLF